MKRATSFLFVLGSCLVSETDAREWTDITLFHGLEPIAASSIGDVDARIDEVDPFFFTASPLMPPTLLPSASPSTSEPSKQPTPAQTVTPRPTSRPPSMSPSFAPCSAPSMTPTSSPTLDEFAPNPAPSNAPSTYFNYDPTSPYGPGNPQLVYHNSSLNKVVYFSNGWESAAGDGYWKEFDDNGFGPWQGVLSRHQLSKSHCGNVGKQSPIDVKSNGAECYEHHQIRSRVSLYMWLL